MWSHPPVRIVATMPIKTAKTPRLLSRPVFFSPLIVLLVSLLLSACAQNPNEPYKPIQAQHGKDVMWMPTSDPLVLAMLDMANVQASDRVYDLGAGDGRIAIEAARVYGATAVGIEYNPKLADFARQNVAKAGLQDKVAIITGDIFEEDFSSATVVTLYLLESLNIKLKPTLLNMKPGTRVVSNSFGMGLWIPDNAVQAPNGTIGMFWVVPSNIAGRWQISGLPGFADNTTGEINLKQSFQFVDGELSQPNNPQSPTIKVEGRLLGDVLTLKYTDSSNQPQTLTFTVDQTQWRPTNTPSAKPVAKRLPS
uniref:SAM-dependent methyltransferase n=2 Tax=Orrella sp. TaxID=1921583 RepID=UPI004047A97E